MGFFIERGDENRRQKNPRQFLNFTKRTWMSLEVFNLMAIRNVASNTWIKSIYGAEFAIPNYLTSRRINLRLRMEF